MINMQTEISGTHLLGFNSSYKSALDKQTRVLNKLQSRYKKMLETHEKVSQKVSLLGLQIEAQARILRDL